VVRDFNPFDFVLGLTLVQSVEILIIVAIGTVPRDDLDPPELTKLDGVTVPFLGALDVAGSCPRLILIFGQVMILHAVDGISDHKPLSWLDSDCGDEFVIPGAKSHRLDHQFIPTTNQVGSVVRRSSYP
jgi:hypothetical protein